MTPTTAEKNENPGTQAGGLLVCPCCHGDLAAVPEGLHCAACGIGFPIKDGIQRFVSPENYAASFGFEWQIHRRTQLDSLTGVSLSADRFFRETGWSRDELAGKRVLECGSGAGRFTEVICRTGAELYSFDLSLAVEANRGNNGSFPNLHLCQASLYEQPFRDAQFDYLLCLGVVQHTPDVERAFKGLFRCLRPGGKFCVDVYAWPSARLHPRAALRPLTRRLPPEMLYRTVRRALPPLLRLSAFLDRIPGIGRYARRLLPVTGPRAYLPITDPALWREWAVLDTFDWLSARYETPQSRRTLERWTRDLHLAEVEIDHDRASELFIVRGRK